MASVQDLSSRYGSQLKQLKAIFPSWDEGDLAFTLQDVKGSVEEAAMMITEGRATQFTEAPSKKKTAKPAAKDSNTRGHSNRNADSGGWDNTNGDAFRGDRGGRGGRGGARGGRGGRGGEPFRGGARGGRGGIRGGRGGYSNTNGASTATNGEASTTDTTVDGWAAQVEASSSAQKDEGAEDLKDQDVAESSTQAVTSGKGDDFAAAGGWGDAPSAKELNKAAKSGGSGWQGKGKQAVSAVNTAAPAPAVPAKLTWAQIAKPIEKPKPAPAPVVEEKPKPVEEETPAPPQQTEETPGEDIEAFGDAPAAQEVEEQAAALPETEAEVQAEAEPHVTQTEVPLPEQETQEEEWQDPAIAGSGGTGAQPEWTQQQQAPAKADAPEPVTTYSGPPGFSSPQATKGPVAQIQASAPPAQPRSNSRAAQRHKDAEGQGVVLPNSVNRPVSSGLNNVDVQFGTLAFGASNPDGADAPVADHNTPAKSNAQLSPLVSPPRALAPPSLPQPTLQSAPQQQQQHQATSATYPYLSQQSQQPGFPQSQPAQHQSQPQQAPNHVTLQQQAQHASNYQAQFLQQQQHQQEQQQQQQQPPVGAQSQAQQNQYYRPNDFYGAGARGQQEPLGASHPSPGSIQQQHTPQPIQPATSASPYDSPFGGFGQQTQQHLYGQGQQQAQQAPVQQQQLTAPSQTHDLYSAGRQAYDSYAASGYPRASDEQKQQPAAPAPSHTPTAPAQQQQQPQQGLQQHQQNQYYSQMGNMGYYQNAPYNPYYQYGQGPQPGFQQYYPLAGRNLYGQPTPPAPPAPIPQTKPAAPYGNHGQSYPASAFDDQSSFNGAAGAGVGGGRFGESKTPSSAQSTQAYSNPSLHGFLGQSATVGRPQASTPDEGFKSSTPSSVGGAAASQPQQAQVQAQGAQQGQQQSHAQGQGQRGGPQGFGGAGYPYGGYQAQDWSQYGQYGGSRNGYAGWQQ